MTDGNEKVVQLRPKNIVSAWSCACGCIWFKLIEGGEVMCDQCGTVQTIRHFDPSETDKGAAQPSADLAKFAADLAAAQRPLDPVAEKVLYENLPDLYIDGSTDKGTAP